MDTDFPSVEEPAVLPSALPVSESSNGPVSNVSYAAVTAASTPAAAPRVQESRPYRNEIFLSSFERANFHLDNVTTKEGPNPILNKVARRKDQSTRSKAFSWSSERTATCSLQDVA